MPSHETVVVAVILPREDHPVPFRGQRTGLAMDEAIKLVDPIGYLVWNRCSRPLSVIAQELVDMERGYTE